MCNNKLEIKIMGQITITRGLTKLKSLGNEIDKLTKQTFTTVLIKEDSKLRCQDFNSTHYDKLRSEREGINAYVKEFDHYCDACRYIIMELALTGRAPVI